MIYHNQLDYIFETIERSRFYVFLGFCFHVGTRWSNEGYIHKLHSLKDLKAISKTMSLKVIMQRTYGSLSHPLHHHSHPDHCSEGYEGCISVSWCTWTGLTDRCMSLKEKIGRGSGRLNWWEMLSHLETFRGWNQKMFEFLINDGWFIKIVFSGIN